MDVFVLSSFLSFAPSHVYTHAHAKKHMYTHTHTHTHTVSLTHTHTNTHSHTHTHTHAHTHASAPKQTVSDLASRTATKPTPAVLSSIPQPTPSNIQRYNSFKSFDVTNSYETRDDLTTGEQCAYLPSPESQCSGEFNTFYDTGVNVSEMMAPLLEPTDDN